MNVLRKCCYRSMKENRKRTMVTIVGVILATALITGVACLVTSSRASLIAYEKQQNGDWHYCFYGVSQKDLKYFEENKNITEVNVKVPLGYALLEGSRNPDKPYLYVSAVGEKGAEANALKLLSGRMPENGTELVVSRHILTNGQVKLQIGDTMTLQLGQRVSGGYPLRQNNPYQYEAEELTAGENRSYTIVGVIERPQYGVEDRMAPGYSAFTCLENPAEAESMDVYVKYTGWGLRHADQVNEALEGLAEYHEDNYYLLKWILLTFSSGTMNMIYAMATLALAVIIVTAVFCIRNSFTISLTEKMKLYGRLASVGTTSRQQRKIVYYEAAFLGMTAIPLGIAGGIFATMVLVRVSSGLLESAMDVAMVFGISWGAVTLSAVLGAVTILLSAWQSARRAARVSPVSAIRANATVKVNARELRCPRWISKYLGIGGKVAWKNLRRTRVKYRTTVISIVVGVAVFIGLTTFVDAVKLSFRTAYKSLEYQLRVSCYNTDSLDRLELAVAEAEGVEAVEMVRFHNLNIPAGSLSLTREYLQDFYQEETFEAAEAAGKEPGLVTVGVYSLGEEGYRRYCSLAGVAESDDQAIVLAEYELDEYDEKGIRHVKKGRVAEFAPGDVIAGTGAEEIPLSITVAAQTDVLPMYLNGASLGHAVKLIVSDRWMDGHWEQLDAAEGSGRLTTAYIRCADPSGVEAGMRQALDTASASFINYEQQYRQEKNMYLLLSIFVYGFITVVALIGVTNIFNTITTNMELRAPEFAMLQAVGMTRREFRRMILLESLFYGGKALLIGIPLGVALSYCFHRAMGLAIATGFAVPWKGIGISVAVVALLLYMIMHYSMAKIKGRNLVQIMQNENL